jgi:hypothetical protein
MLHNNFAGRFGCVSGLRIAMVCSRETKSK